MSIDPDNQDSIQHYNIIIICEYNLFKLIFVFDYIKQPIHKIHDFNIRKQYYFGYTTKNNIIYIYV